MDPIRDDTETEMLMQHLTLTNHMLQIQVEHLTNRIKQLEQILRAKEQMAEEFNNIARGGYSE